MSESLDRSFELPGLRVVLDRLEYRSGEKTTAPETPHVFIYYLTIHNDSDRTVVLLGRKWVVLDDRGSRLVIEGDKIVGHTPELKPGQSFSYNSFHMTAGPARAEGSFHGVDEDGRKIHVKIPAFALEIPA